MKEHLKNGPTRRPIANTYKRGKRGKKETYETHIKRPIERLGKRRTQMPIR